MGNDFIKLDNVSKIYHTKKDEILAVNDVNLTVNKGEFVSLVGPSGCGKSTILSMISGLFPPTKGKIYIEGQLINGNSKKLDICFSKIIYLIGEQYLKTSY